MLVTAIVLYCVVALGLLAMAAKFGLGPVPASHHAEAMSQDGVDVTPKLEMVLRGVYQAMAGAYLGLALLVVYLALVPIRAGQSEAALIGLASLAVGVPGAYRARQLAIAARVSTPWQMAAILSLVAVAATILAILA
ncbi:MAG: hypothetical protein J0H34_22635 [Rhizobiales bacterium]|nr:hypothetical protein [Hyphomicrobiales bacterium]